MKKLLASAVAALALTVTANVASAEEQDVAKIKCSEFWFSTEKCGIS